MRTKKSGIYAILCAENGKLYIGRSMDMVNRKSRHFTSLRKNVHHNKSLQYDYNVYGEGRFSFIILEHVSPEILREREEHWILENIDRSYNLVLGSSGLTGYLHTEESKVKMSEWQKDRRFSEEHKKKLSESHKGYQMPQEQKDKIRAANKGRVFIDIEKAKEIKRLILDGVKYREIAKQLKVGVGTIVAINKGTHPVCDLLRA